MIPPRTGGTWRSLGLSFEQVRFFDWSSALVVEDDLRDYGERRFLAVGPIGDRLHVLVFTARAGKVHVISLRRANNREWRRYEEKIGQEAFGPARD